jgi:hypothetical protein
MTGMRRAEVMDPGNSMDAGNLLGLGGNRSLGISYGQGSSGMVFFVSAELEWSFIIELVRVPSWYAGCPPGVPVRLEGEFVVCNGTNSYKSG